MAYSQKDVTNGIKKKKKPIQADELIDEIDQAFKETADEDFWGDTLKTKKIVDEEEEKEEEPVKEEKKEEAVKEEKVSEETESIDTEIMDKIKEEFEEDLKSFQKDRPTKEKDYTYKSPISAPLILLILGTIFSAVAYFVAVLMNQNSSVYQIISGAVLSLFSIHSILPALIASYISISCS